MSVPIITKYDNGSTLIYQRDPNLRGGVNVALGFAGGSQFDGEKAGLSHLLEHLLFTEVTPNKTKNKLTQMDEICFDTNAATWLYTIFAKFSATNENLDKALKFFVDSFKNTKFSEQQIKNEIEVIKHEINMYKTPNLPDNNAVRDLIDNLTVDNMLDANILGTSRTLKTITPADLRNYGKKYFNSNNLIVSITGNLPFEEIERIVAINVLSQFEPAKKEEYIAEYMTKDFSVPANFLTVNPNKESPNATICFLLKNGYTTTDRRTPKDLAIFALENYYFNNLAGPFDDAFRTQKQLVYSYGLGRYDIGSTIYKVAQFLTSPAKIRKTIKTFCEVYKNIGQNGITEKEFNRLKKNVCDMNTVLNLPDSCDAENNFYYHIQGKTHVSSKQVINALKKITYEDFNYYLKSTFSQGDISLAVDGNFDTRKMYNIIEIEHMIGNDKNISQLKEFNQPYAETSGVDMLEMLKLNNVSIEFAEEAQMQK